MALPTKQAAAESEAWLAENAHGPAFFEKLASDYGIRPRNRKESEQLLQMGPVLAQRHRAGRYKTAAEQQNEEPNPFLKHAMDALGIDAEQQAEHHSADYIDKAALELVRTSKIAKQAGLIYDYVINGGELSEAEEETAAA